MAQELALSRPGLIRRVILAGTGPKGGSGMQESRPDVAAAATSDDPGGARAFLFFSPSQESQGAAKLFLARTATRTTDDPTSSKQTMMAQGEAIQAWGTSSIQDHLRRLRNLAPPTLVVSGNDDIMVPTINSFTLSEAIPKAELIIYPDAGHGSLFQYAPLFVEHARPFLDRADPGLT